LVLFGIQDNCLNGDCQIEIDDLEGSIENIALKVAGKLLPDHKVYHLGLLVFFISDSFVLFQQDRVLSGKLKHDGFIAFPHKLVHYISLQVAIVKGEEESARDSPFEPFYVDWDKLSNFETNITRKIVERSWWLFFFQDFVCRELWHRLLSEILYQLCFHVTLSYAMQYNL